MLDDEARLGHVAVEVVESEVAVDVEPGDHEPVGSHVGRDPPQHDDVCRLDRIGSLDEVDECEGAAVGDADGVRELTGGAFVVAQLPMTGCPAKSLFTNGTESMSEALTAPP